MVGQLRIVLLVTASDPIGFPNGLINGFYYSIEALTRFHGVFAPNSKLRAWVTPAKRGKGNQAKVADDPPTPAERRAAMSWAQRLKRVFNIDIETCRECGGAVKVIACIEDPVVIQKILDHLKEKPEPNELTPWPETRAPPAGLFG